MSDDLYLSDDEEGFYGPDAFVDGDYSDDGPPDDSSPISFHDLSHLLGGRRFNRVLGPTSDFLRAFGGRRQGQNPHDRDDHQGRQWFAPHTAPQQAGLDLLLSGEFGRVCGRGISRHKHLNMARMIHNPQHQFRAAAYVENISSNLVPNTNGTAVAVYDSNVYSGQFSGDSSFYYTCAQDFRLRIYDMLAPPTLNTPLAARNHRRRSIYDGDSYDGHESTMSLLKTIQGHEGGWTITDSHLSPDNQRIIYSSITPIVYMAHTVDSSSTQIPLHFSSYHPRNLWNIADAFGIWSCRFSADGNEVIAGGNRNIFAYDLPTNRRSVSIVAHDDDVNSCCWADTDSGNVLISASDDTFIKVWDRRSLGSSLKPSGALIGHTEGITYVSAKGDGRYIISNGKDQSLRLWDLRKMRSNTEFERVSKQYYGTNFDYRYGRFPKPRYAAHPQDCSVMTYRGHAVLRTLIRCHFSPAETTGSQYIYSGSANGKIHIWSLDGQVVQVLDRSKTLPMAFDPSGPEPESLGRHGAQVCVRDVSWHSQQPVMMSAAWEGDRGGSVVARHEWKGLAKMPGALEDWVEKKKLERLERKTTSGRIPGGFEDD